MDYNFADYDSHLPLFLEDSKGSLTGSVFFDLYNRLTLSYSRLPRSEPGNALGRRFAIYNHNTRRVKPEILLEFADDNSLGTIQLGDCEPILMDDYLPRVSSSASSKSRHFFASDGQQYQWRHRHDVDQEWACTKSDGEVVSYYSLKLYGEPEYKSSGCMLTVEKEFARLSCEMLATCMIMRHIAHYDL